MGHFWPILGHLGPFMVTFWPSRVILDLDVALGHSRRVFFFFFVANIAFTRFFCRECRDYVLFGVEFCQKFWQKFLEILRILAEILRKKLATGASGWMLELELSERWKKLEKSRSKERSQLQQAAVTGRQLDDIKSGRIDWKTHV